jgi:hypothetical protein
MPAPYNQTIHLFKPALQDPAHECAKRKEMEKEKGRNKKKNSRHSFCMSRLYIRPLPKAILSIPPDTTLAEFASVRQIQRLAKGASSIPSSSLVALFYVNSAMIWVA